MISYKSKIANLLDELIYHRFGNEQSEAASHESRENVCNLNESLKIYITKKNSIVK